MDLTSKTPAEGLFDLTIDLPGQMVSEELLRRVAPPPWPEDILGPIDRDKVAKGEKLFGENCASCHSTWPHRWSEPKLEGKRFIENAIVPIAIVGTDATQFTSPQFDPRPTIRTGALAGSLEATDTGAVLASPPAVFLAVTRGVFGRALDKLHLSPEALRSAHGYRSFFPDPQEPVPALLAYKAQTAEGMWSAPPFLHNGSVPNLYELLGPAAARSRTFFIGREFDPVRVGVDTSGNSGTFLYNTLLIGNANTGHSFEDGPRGNGVIGRKLSEEDRWDLVEYMKSIPSQPHQIVPFGGPANPFRAWTDTSFFNLQNPGTYNGAPVLN